MHRIRWTLLIILVIVSTSNSKKKNPKVKSTNSSNSKSSKADHRDLSMEESDHVTEDRKWKKMIDSKNITKWGKWGAIELCPNETFVMGMKLKTQTDQSYKDNSGLNGIKLFCGELAVNDELAYISSTVGDFGEYGADFYCDRSVMRGFKLRSQEVQPRDNSAANNFAMVCSNGDLMDGDGQSKGKWQDPKRCPNETAVCGIQTQVEKKHVGDNSALNNVRIYCCSVINLSSQCKAEDTWQTILTCDNLEAINPSNCVYSKKQGVSKHQAATERQTNTYNVQREIGFSVGALIKPLGGKFSASASDSLTTGLDWSQESSSTWREETEIRASFDVPGGTKAVLKQALGKCGYFGVSSAYLKKYEYDNNGTVKSMIIKDSSEGHIKIPSKKKSSRKQ